MNVWLLLLAVFVVSWRLTLVLRRYALAKSLMDIPNERSSHSIPTPRGGGVAIVIAFVVAVPMLWALGLLAVAEMYGLLCSGLIVAVIGFADDHGHIAARWRLLGHFFAAGLALFFLGGLPSVSFFGAMVDLGWIGNILALIYLVWMLNLYNFMDGIDGLASAEAVCVCLGGALLYWQTAHHELVWTPLILASAVAGFLCWNLPPARIFMGDAGSGFLGIILGVLTLKTSWENPQLLWSWVILLGVFIVDATFTLCRRLLQRQKVYQAHRSHAYQHAAQQFQSHKRVTVTVVAINVAWLMPISMLVANGAFSGLLGVLIAYVPLIALAFYFKAGSVSV